MSETKLAGFHLALDWGRKTQQPKEIRHRRTIFSGALGDLLLSHVKITAQAVVGASLLHRVQVCTLEILYDRHLHRLLVAYLAKNGRDRLFGGFHGSAPATFASDQLETAIGERPHNDRLDYAIGDNGARQLIQLLLVDLHARLVGIGVNLVGRNFSRGAARMGLDGVGTRVMLSFVYCQASGPVSS